MASDLTHCERSAADDAISCSDRCLSALESSLLSPSTLEVDNVPQSDSNETSTSEPETDSLILKRPTGDEICHLQYNIPVIDAGPKRPLEVILTEEALVKLEKTVLGPFAARVGNVETQQNLTAQAFSEMQQSLLQLQVDRMEKTVKQEDEFAFVWRSFASLAESVATLNCKGTTQNHTCSTCMNPAREEMKSVMTRCSGEILTFKEPPAVIHPTTRCPFFSRIETGRTNGCGRVTKRKRCLDSRSIAEVPPSKRQCKLNQVGCH